MALALAVLICEFALISPIVVASENRPAQQDSSETLTQLIQRLSSEGMAELTHLTSNYSPRQYFTEEEFAAAAYIEGKMRSLSGYAVTVQSFVLSDEHSGQVSRLSLVSPPARDVRSQVMEGSAMGDVTAPVVAVGNALDTDIPDAGLSGNIALIERGSISFAEQANRVAEAGAVGAIIYNSEERTFRNGQPFSGTLIEGDYNGSSIPVTGIWREEGTNILNALNEGTEVRARLKTASEKWASQNIIAEKAGTDSGADVVVVGAHYDTHRDSQGASDNGTGVASLMVMADEISSLQLAHTVRFIFFGAEEPGLHGSTHYVESLSRSERSEIIAMLNLTSLGSGRPAVKTGGSTVLTDWVIDTYAPQNSLDVRYWGPQYGFSDHAPFYKVLGVPAISFHGDDLSVSNSPDDVIGLVGSSVMGTQMAIALEMIKQAPSIVPLATPTAQAPFTAHFLGLPERHDGEKAFEFYLVFNDVPDELSHRTVRYGLLHVGGADITDVSRIAGYSENLAWTVTVEPTQRGDITIQLPVRDCTDTASVCADGRPLSEGLSRTVPGPDSSVTSMRNTPAAGGPVIEGSPVVGETLTATTTGIIDADGMTGAVFAFKWLADDAETANATSSSYTLTDSEQGKAIKVRVTFTDDAGNDETLTSDATEAVKAANSPATGAPTTSGTAQVGETLTATTTGIADEDGRTNAVFAFKWLADDAEMANATSSSYTLTDSEQGKAIKVRVTFTDDAGNDETLTSDATEAVKAANSPATGAPTTSGTAQVGETLTATTTGIADEDGRTNAVFAYHWLADDAAIEGATAATFTLTSSEQGKTIKVRVTFTDDAGNEESVTSDATAAVAATNSPATGGPVIEGTPSVGQTLTATTSGIGDDDGIATSVFAYHWLADDAAIEGATASTYTLTYGEQGKTIKVTVTFTDDAGNDESLTSDATEAVKQPLTASIENAPDSHDGQSVFTFELRFSEEFGLSYKILQDHAFTVTGGAAIKARRLNPPGNVRWEISVRPSGDGALTIVLPATTDCASSGAVCTEDGRKLSSALEITVPGREEQQESNSPATGAPTISGRAQVGETLTATTSGIADADGIANAIFTYQWLADNAAIGGATASTYTLTSGERGKTIKVRVTFTDDAGNEESLTSEATAGVAAANSPATGAPTISGRAQVGETLTATTSGIADADGIANAIFTYQWLADDAAIGGATALTYTLTSGEQGKTIKVTVTFTDDAGNEESLISDATAAVTQPLTATIHDAPDSHDGQSKFTFELRFSEEFGLSYKTLRDHAFTVTGGEVVKARRLEKGKNVRWEIHVRPDSSADVIIVLPATADCASDGTICTEDGRMLSSRLVFTVSGP